MSENALVKYNPKDIEVLKFIGLFGKSFAEVLGKTFYGSVQSARNNISRMKKVGMIKQVPTGLMKPRNAVILSSSVKRLLVDMGHTPKESRVSIGQLEHNMIEQMAYYHLSKIGEVERATVYRDKNKYHSVPDLVLTTPAGKIFVEVEMHQKSRASYKDFVAKSSKDRPRAVLYVCQNTKIMTSIANAMPTWDKLVYIDIETLIDNIARSSKVGATKQQDLLREDRKRADGLFNHS